MSRLRLTISMSLDGYVAGPDQSLEDPLGVGGERLHEWVFATAEWHRRHGRDTGEESASSELLAAQHDRLGATIMGRSMFGGQPGPWNPDEPWNGWWGDEPPYHHPVFVLTHHPREPLVLGETTFTFVTDGIESALQQAREAAADRVVAVAGGATACQQYLAAGLVDEAYINLVPILLGGGERLLDNVGDDLHGLELVGAVDAPGVTHLKLSRS